MSRIVVDVKEGPVFEWNFRRISHRTHHQNHGHVEKDESWHPVGFLSLSLLVEPEKLC